MANNSNPYEVSGSDEYEEYEFIDDEEDFCGIEGEVICADNNPSEMEAEDAREEHNHNEIEEEMSLRQEYLFFFNNLVYLS